MRNIEESLRNALESIDIDCTNLSEVQNFVDFLYPVVSDDATAIKKQKAITFFYRPEVKSNNDIDACGQ